MKLKEKIEGMSKEELLELIKPNIIDQLKSTNSLSFPLDLMNYEVRGNGCRVQGSVDIVNEDGTNESIPYSAWISIENKNWISIQNEDLNIFVGKIQTAKQKAESKRAKRKVLIFLFIIVAVIAIIVGGSILIKKIQKHQNETFTNGIVGTYREKYNSNYYLTVTEDGRIRGNYLIWEIDDQLRYFEYSKELTYFFTSKEKYTFPSGDKFTFKVTFSKKGIHHPEQDHDELILYAGYVEAATFEKIND